MASASSDAMSAWRRLLGSDRVMDPLAAQQRYGAGTEGFARRLAGALRPASAEQIPELVRIAAASRQPLYPISTGRNWGYGSAGPVCDDCVLLDLGDLNAIRAFDAERGLVTLEPGVTQAMLRQFLDAGGHRFMVPVTGAGPSVSLLGNALERGYGITPHTDHFAAVTSLEAVLADGSLYRPALAAWGGEAVDRGFKWGVGPYLDGLFTQGGFGIVTAMTIALAPEPEAMEVLLFGFPREEDLALAIGLVQTLFRRFRGVLGGVNLVNRRRALAMLEPYPAADKLTDGVISKAHLEQMAKRHQVQPWTGLTALYGDPAVVAGAKRAIRRLLRPHTVRLMFLSQGRIRRLRQLANWLPGPLGAGLSAQLTTLDATADIMLGRPREIVLPLAYWKSGTLPTSDRNPARDGCGLLWFAPLLPLTRAAATDFAALAERIMREHRIEPLITFTCFSELSADSTLPILYDPADPAERARAHACYWALFEACRQRGYLPYRLSVEHQRELADKHQLWQLAGRLKRALDPHNLIAPGRYAPSTLPGGTEEPRLSVSTDRPSD